MSTSFKSTSGGDGTIEADVVIVGSSTISGTEIAFIDGVTAGTVTASKAVVVDANKRIDTIVIADGGLKLGTAGGTAVTSTAAELNILDGVTATAAELNILDGVTSTAAELNILDGVTRTAAQINLLTQGVAAGYKVARGSTTPVSSSDTVATGLATVVAVVVQFKGAPTLTHMFNAGDIGDQAGTPAAGSFLLKSYKPTASGDVTPTASSTPWAAVDWFAIGT